MAWQGIPFSLEQNNSIENVRVAFEAVPKILIDAPPDYTNAIITGIVSLVAGVIPALIAVWTFKRNAENAKEEREKQLAFLAEDREKQQLSLEQDRETQLKVAEKNFNMQVLSGNRQNWINNLRDVVSEYTVEAPRLISVTYDYKLKRDYQKSLFKQVADNTIYSKTDKFKAELNDVNDRVDSANKSMGESSDRISLLSVKIRMMLNPNEEEYLEILSVFSRVREINAEIVNEKSNSDLYERNFSEALRLVDKIVSLAQAIFKKEWQRVKAGV
ncbi:hypothetical protein OLZ33_08615 [Pantoea ananatis]|uniref:hypothetical protein n=1 Tax=Pantoea ananas TaxID=553 RepID=UPI00158A9593|nr:hypothetical protein [Pantoea ananatis]MBA4819464.1 hypothetical protein [Pantoea ananatis]MCW1832063.1 hypothetical protein [Pantoea ananatis]QKV86327.1 hypothetical protein FOB88_03870 [Pantoea ananatis]